jgi:hypothetical protein
MNCKSMIFPLCLFLPMSVNAQDREEEVFNGGILLGGNASSLIGDEFDGYHKAGLNNGGFVQLKLNKHFGLSMDLSYSEKGVKGRRTIATESLGTEVQEYKLDLKYMAVSLQGQYFISPAVTLGCGLSYGQLLSAHEEGESEDSYEGIDNPEPRNNDISALAAVTLKLSEHWYMMGGYEQSVQPVKEDEEIAYKKAPADQYNSGFSLRFLYVIK